MAKITRSYTLDNEIVEELGNVTNSSKLINELLVEHFFGTNKNKKEEINIQIKKMIIQKDEIEAKMIMLVQRYDEIERVEKEQAKVFKDLPKEILEDFNRFPDMTEDVLKNRWDELYKEIIEWNSLKGFYAQFVDGRTTN